MFSYAEFICSKFKIIKGTPTRTVPREIQWKRSSEFEKMVIRLGGFHILMNYLGTIGKMVAGSAVAELLVESGLYSETTTTKQYNRGIQAHKKLMLEALGTCEWDEFRRPIQDHCYDDVLERLETQANAFADLCVADANQETLKEAFDAVVISLGELSDEFAEFRTTLKGASHS